MKTLLIFFLLISINCFSQSVAIETNEKADLIEMNNIYIAGLTAIRHDCLISFRFRKARELKFEIRELKKKHSLENK